MLSETGRAAVDYIGDGLAIIALHPHRKTPSFAHGLKDATTCAEDVAAWFQDYPDDNLAIVTGAVSGGLGVIDIDVDEDEGKDGFEFLNRWEREHGELPETWTVKTARGGCHLYYRFSDGVPRNTANEALAIDFRGEGGYVMAPPSIHPNGNRVEWEIHPDDVELAEADENVLEFLRAIAPAATDSARFELPETISKGGRDETIFKYACSLQAAGRPDWEIRATVKAANEALCVPPLPPDAVEAKIKSALKYEKGKPLNLAEIKKPETGVVLERRASGAPLQSLTNCLAVLSHDEDLKDRFVYDESAYTRMKQLPLPWRQGSGYERIRDADYIELAAYMEAKYGLTQKRKVEDALLAITERNPVNPKKDWLNGLRWDGRDRINTLASVALGCSATAYNAQIMRLFLYGCVARIFQPGCKFDYMLVLYGPQGIGKSTFVRRLATRPEWYLDNMTEFGGDEAANTIRGKWIVEIAELQAFSKRDVNQIKAYCSQQYEDVRPKYGRESEQRPRQCCFVGTTNSHDFLTDRTGNRRFLILECGTQEATLDIFDDECEAYFEQVWAQAAAEWQKLKPPLVVPEGLSYETDETREEFMLDDPRVGMIEQYLAAVLESGTHEPRVCIASICENALNLSRDAYQGNARLSREISDIMRHSIKGWEAAGRSTFDRYGRQRAWRPTPSPEQIANETTVARAFYGAE